MKLAGNTIFIAGATSGIGLGLALRLHATGNRVIVSGRRKNRLAQIVAENPGVESVVLDTTDPVAIQDVTVQLLQRFPDLNVLVAMAGIMLPEDLLTGGFLTTAEATVATNLLGPIRLVAALTEHLATRPAGQHAAPGPLHAADRHPPRPGGWARRSPQGGGLLVPDRCLWSSGRRTAARCRVSPAGCTTGSGPPRTPTVTRLSLMLEGTRG
jgi:NAD(P)-dependent dehydrogenase (short-subunit alcohol dehydrogenase family)